jgi:hypothetical protein
MFGCRLIGREDLDAIASLLFRGFANRPRKHWVRSLQILSKREPPNGYPQFGYMLEHNNRAVGALLMICSRSKYADAVRCNGSSWYVAPEFRSYAAFLLAKTLRHQGTHTNITPRAHTLLTIEALGFKRFCTGAFAAVPLACRVKEEIRVSRVREKTIPRSPVPPEDLQFLWDHEGFGCISLWCETESGKFPLVFRRRFVRSLPFVPCAQLIYAPAPDIIARLARPVGEYLAKLGMPYMVVYANSPVSGLRGQFFDGKLMYYRGPEKPAPHDLAYTEAAMFGL